MKECCGVVLALQHWRPYLWGKHFKCVTDHAVLTHLYYMQDTSNMLTRWAIALQGFDFTARYSQTIHDRSRSCHPKSTPLTRRARLYVRKGGGWCGYQVLSPRSYRLIVTIILKVHPGSSGALWGHPCCWPPRVRLRIQPLRDYRLTTSLLV